MTDDMPIREIINDPDLTSYRGFMDYDWAKAVGEQSVDTIVEYPVFDVIMSWKGASNTFAMPLLMIHGSTSFWTAYSKSHCDQSMVFAIIQNLGERLCKEVGFTSALSQPNFGIDRLEFIAGVTDLHSPIDAALSLVDIGGPGRDFLL